MARGVSTEQACFHAVLLKEALRTLNAGAETCLKLFVVPTILDMLANCRPDHFGYGLIFHVRYGLELICLLGIQANRHCLLTHTEIMPRNTVKNKYRGGLVSWYQSI